MMNSDDFKIDPKMRKQEVERKRRLRMASALEKLKEIMQIETGVDYKKADKVEILESTVKFLKEKHRTEHEESFSSGYNSCLVEISGRLMSATDIDLKSKSILLTFISKLSSTKHSNNESKQPKYQTTTKLENSVLTQPTAKKQNQDDPKPTRSPLTNIQNVKIPKFDTNNEIKTSQENRGMKRSRSHSNEKENTKKSRIDYKEFSTVPHQKLDHRPPIKGKYSIENTNIAVIQKNSEGKYTEISNIPLKALLKNLQHFQQNDSKQNVDSKINKLATTTTTETIQKDVPPRNNGFSYMRLLQEDNIDLELLKSTSNENILKPEPAMETIPLNPTHKIISLPPLSVFLNEQD